MLQDIFPHKFNCEFTKRPPRASDRILCMRDGEVLLGKHKGEFLIPCYEEMDALLPEKKMLIYLFSVDDTVFYLYPGTIEETGKLKYRSGQTFRKVTPQWLAFAGATAVHLARWYESNRFCGRCGAETRHKGDERALCCPACSLIEYPRISPVVIVAVTDGDKILLTKHAAGEYRRYALVAGYVEIGETLEDAARREVMEEVGLKIKNLHYFASQPWAFSSSILSGFFAELDGSPEITLDTRELAEATWFARKNIPPAESDISLTWTMINRFRDGSR